MLTTAQQAVLHVHMALLGQAPGNALFAAHMATANANLANWAHEVNSYVHTLYAGTAGTAALANTVVAHLGLGAVPGIREQAIAFFGSQPTNSGVLVFEAAQWLRHTTFSPSQPELLEAQAAFRAAEAAAFAHASHPASAASAPAIPDAGFTLSASSPGIIEGATGSTSQLVFNLTLDRAPNQGLSLPFSTLLTGTATAGTDFTLHSGSVSFAQGQRSATVRVPVIGDNTPELDETVQIQFTSARLVAPVRATGLIHNDDFAPHTLRVSAPSVAEGAAGSVRELFFVLQLDRVPDRSVTIHFQTLNAGSALAGLDFSPHSGQITFAPQQTHATVAVPVLGDDTYEPDETMHIEFSGPRLVASAVAIGTIRNDDVAPPAAPPPAAPPPAAPPPAAPPPAAPAPASLTLTHGTDNLVGTAANDTFHATPFSFSPSDRIDGGAGHDTLVIRDTVGLMATAAPTGMVLAVEQIDIHTVDALGDVATAYDLSGVAGLGLINVTSANYINLKLAATTDATLSATRGHIDLEGGRSVAVTVQAGSVFIDSGALTEVRLSGVATQIDIGLGTPPPALAAPSPAIKLNGLSTSGGFGLDALITTLNIHSGTAASSIHTLTAAGATVLNLAGDAALAIHNHFLTALNTIHVSNTAGVALGAPLGNGVAFNGGAGADAIVLGNTTQAIQMGAGNDTVTLQAAALGAGGSVNGGAGTDTLRLSATHAATAAANPAFAASIDGFERLSLLGPAGSAAIALNQIDGINFVALDGVSAGQTLTLNGATTGVTVAAHSGAAGTIAVALATPSAADVLNVHVSAAGAQTIHALNASSFETINFVLHDTDAAPNGDQHRISNLAAPDATTLTVTGNAGLSLNFAGTQLRHFDASGVSTGAVIVNTGALVGAATLTGGAGADTLAAASAAVGVVLNGGAGNDLLIGSAAADLIRGGDGDDQLVAGAGADTLVGGAGHDTFVLTTNATPVFATLADATAGDMLRFADQGTEVFDATRMVLGGTTGFTDYLNAAADHPGTNVALNAAIRWFQFAGNTYAVQDNSMSNRFDIATDIVVELTGLLNLGTATWSVAHNTLTLA